MKGESLISLLGRDRRLLVLTAALAVAVLAAAVFGWFYRQAQSQEQSLDEKHHVLIENIGQLRLLDETLTMSARMVAATDDPEYEDLYKDRYDEAATEYEQLVEDTINLFPESDARQQFETTKEPSDRLFELEDRSFTLAQEGQDSEAFALLESPEYERYKQDYTEGLDSTFAALLGAEEQAQQLLQAYRLALLGAGVLGLCLILLGWAFTINTLTLGVRYDHHPSKSAKANRGRPRRSLSHMQKLCSATFAAKRARKPLSS